MGQTKRLITSLALFMFFILSAPVLAQTTPDQTFDFRHFYGLAVQAYQDGDYQAFLQNMMMVLAERPNNPSDIYNVACGFSLVGDEISALQFLERVADMGLYFDVENESDFDPIRDNPEFAKIAEKFAENRQPIGSSEVAFTIPQKGLIVESVAYNPADSSFYLASIHQRKIIEVSSDGTISDFTTEAQDGLWSVFGIKVDAERGHLWACSSATPNMKDFYEDENGQAGIFKYDLATGQLLKKYILPDPERNHVLGDLTLNANGDVFTTDSFTKEVYIIPRESDEIQRFYYADDFFSLQGLTFSDDERYLFLADYSRGIMRLDMNDKSLIELSCPINVDPTGIDGLYFFEGSLIGIQNRMAPHRVSRFYLTPDLDGIDHVTILEANNPRFDEPTLGVLVDDTLFYNANSQWSRFNDDGTLFPSDQLDEPVIMKLDLE